jgi:hypothetical protein
MREEELSMEDAFEFGLISTSIVRAFESRGYALYLVSSGGPIFFTDQYQLAEFIAYGREKLMLDLECRYVVLPLVDKDKEPAAIMQAIAVVIEQIRAPYFFDLEQTREGGVKVKSKHLVDSVRIVSPNLELTVDIRFAKSYGNTIELPLAVASEIIRKQMLLCIRGPKAEKPSELL